MQFDAVLLLSFGGPNGPDDVMPFLRNVLRGRPVPPERIEAVAQHYLRFGGRSPINEHNRALLEAMRAEFASHDRDVPVYWGNRNWVPYLADTVARMRDDGVRRAAVFATSAYSSYSSCRQYLEDIHRARREVGASAPELLKLRPFSNHPGFVEPLADGLRAGLAEVGPGAAVLMSAHSLPEAMAESCDYERELTETAALVAESAGIGADQWRLVFQSRSGPPTQPWLGPDVVEAIQSLPAGTTEVLVTPIGFVSDHMEVVYDLDVAAAETAAARGVKLIRTATPGTHPRFVHMICELIAELEDPEANPPMGCGRRAAASWPCLAGCCPPPGR